MNEDKDFDHRILAAVKEGAADCVRMSEVAAAIRTTDGSNSRNGCIAAKKVNLLTVVAQHRPDRESNPRPLDHKCDVSIAQ